MKSAEDPDDVRAAQAGDVRAFERLYQQVQPRLVRYLRTLVVDEAPDVASETWLQVARDLRDFRGGAPDFTAWVITIGRHRALDHLRKARRRPADLHDPFEVPEQAQAPDAADLGEEALATRRALDLIRQLPQDQAEAVMLRVIVGLDAPSAARVLGKRAGAVRMATSRGLERLRLLVGDEAAASPGVTLPDRPAL
jgi:RNA polymerase sigma-70 factor (ECF subfamily)